MGLSRSGGHVLRVGRDRKPPAVGRGGRRWWAHCTFTRMNIGPFIREKKIEDLMDSQAIYGDVLEV